MTVGQKVLLFLQHRVFRSIVLLLSLALTIGVIRSVVTIWQKRGIVAERKAVLEAEIAKQRELERRLQEATSAAFIERAAREKLGLVREVETVVIMDKSSTPAGIPSDQKKLQDSSSWKQWWKLFF